MDVLTDIIIIIYNIHHIRVGTEFERDLERERERKKMEIINEGTVFMEMVQRCQLLNAPRSAAGSSPRYPRGPPSAIFGVSDYILSPLWHCV